MTPLPLKAEFFELAANVFLYIFFMIFSYNQVELKRNVIF
jgi:hypothetical protein